MKDKEYENLHALPQLVYLVTNCDADCWLLCGYAQKSFSTQLLQSFPTEILAAINTT